MIKKNLIDFLGEAPYAGNYGTEIIAFEPVMECVTKWQEIFTGNPLLRAWHGGIVSGVLELTGTLALINSAKTKDCTLLSIDTSYLRPAVGDKSLCSRASVVRSGKRIHTIHAVAWQKSFNELVAMASLTFTANPLCRAGTAIR